MLDIIYITISLIILLYFIKTALKSKSPVKNAAKSMLVGAAALALTSVGAGLFGVIVAVNIYTVFIALTLGIPGVILIILKLFL